MKMHVGLIAVLIIAIGQIRLTRQQAVADRLAMPDGATCGSQTPAYLVMDSFKLLTDDKMFYEDVEEEECKIMCSDNKDDHGKSVLCASFTYNFKSRLCSLNKGKASPAGKDQPKAAIGSRYYEKICLPDGSPSSCGESPFFRANQAVLVGFAANMTEAKNLSGCVDNCVKFGKGNCKSAMYFPISGECILNSGSAQGAPDVFVDENAEDVVYFENGCVLTNQIRDQKTSSLSPTSKPNRARSTTPHHRSQSPKITPKPKSQSRVSTTQDDSTTTKSQTGTKSKVTSPKLDASLEEDQDDHPVVTVRARPLTVPTTANQAGSAKDVSSDEPNAEYGQWGTWSNCDRPDGRRFRRRKCPKGKKCRGLDIETQWCSDVALSELASPKRPSPPNDPEPSSDEDSPSSTEQSPVPTTQDPSSASEEVDDDHPLTTSRRPKVTRTTKPTTTSTTTTSVPVGLGSDKWTEWSDQCRPFDEPNGCRFGTRLGFQTRQCLKTPFECQGPFFRYCIQPC